MLICTVAASTVWLASVVRAEPLKLVPSNPQPHAGFFELHWAATELPLRVQESQTDNFQILRRQWRVEGFSSLSLSGLNNGIYFYRLVDQQGQVVSNVIRIEVQHHGLNKAFAFFLVGGFVFLILLVALLTASRSSVVVSRMNAGANANGSQS